MARLLPVALAFVALAAACVSSPNPSTGIPDAGWNDRTSIDLMVRVQNDHYDPVRVTAVWRQMNYHLGEVQPGSSALLRLPGYLLESQGGPRFLADPTGSAQDLLTGPVECSNARVVEWRIKRNLHPSRPRVMD